jgi:hypothetical protein
MDPVIYEVFVIKLFSEFKTSFAEEFLECTFRDCLVLFLQRGSKSDAHK